MDTGASTAADWQIAVDQALHGVRANADLLFLFASYHHSERYPEIVSAIMSGSDRASSSAVPGRP